MINENKVYGRIEMEREMNLRYFIFARLKGNLKRNDKK